MNKAERDDWIASEIERSRYLASPEGQRETYEKELIAQGFCPKCDGMGDTGYEEESGMPFVCYACGGTGKCSHV